MIKGRLLGSGRLRNKIIDIPPPMIPCSIVNISGIAFDDSTLFPIFPHSKEGEYGEWSRIIFYTPIQIPAASNKPEAHNYQLGKEGSWAFVIRNLIRAPPATLHKTVNALTREEEYLWMR